MAFTAKYSSDTGAGAHDGSSEANAWTWAEMVTAIVALGAGGGAGLHVKHKSNGGTSRTTNTDTLSVGGSSTSPLIIEGYLSTPGAAGALGDGYLGRTNNHCCGGSLTTTNMPSITYTTGRLVASGTWIVIQNINYASANTSTGLSLGTDCAIARCKIVNSGTGAGAIVIGGGGSRTHFFDNDIALTGGSGGSNALTASGSANRVIGNRITGASAPGVLASNTGGLIYGNLIYSCTGTGLSVNANTATIHIIGNTIVGCTGDGIDLITGLTQLASIFNNCITDNGGYGINGVSAANAAVAAYNRLRDNTSGNTNLATDWLAGTSWGHVTTDTGGAETDYVSSGSQDYRLRGGSPAANALYNQAIGAFQFSYNPVTLVFG